MSEWRSLIWLAFTKTKNKKNTTSPVMQIQTVSPFLTDWTKRWWTITSFDFARSGINWCIVVILSENFYRCSFSFRWKRMNALYGFHIWIKNRLVWIPIINQLGRQMVHPIFSKKFYYLLCFYRINTNLLYSYKLTYFFKLQFKYKMVSG